ncbi:AfsA-related hotdog domain-containing protein [Streptomyces sp. NBRC 109706]|uniref:AfsA-related hotdog domain-containing protein n=1 Tax=Streptomyces sp. NBRC 109706 TaxID=1550035 RepID=UPI0007858B18|nr:AfsA-related hotdog domain-containing protein [Streptomyces sp. NBRC 109706]
MTNIPDHEPPLPAGVDLGFERTVPRELAHRRQLGEVFVADSARVGEGEDDFVMSFQIPRAHSLWSDRDPAHHDPFASAEAARQAIFVMLHRHVGVEVGLPFSLQRISFRVEDPAAYRDDDRSPLEGFARYRIVERSRRGADVTGMRLAGTIGIAGRRAMTLTAQLAFMSRADYDVFRAFQRGQKPVATARATPVTRLAPAAVGRSIPRNVVIGTPRHAQGGGEPLLALDQGHPAFFDHDYDHIPGPLMAEAMRQAAVAAADAAGLARPADALAVGLTAKFLDFAEFEADLVCEAKVGDGTDDEGRLPVAVVLRQFGKPVVEGRVDLLPDPRRSQGRRVPAATATEED